MAVLICGGAGYIGSHVNKLLHERKYETIILDNLVHGHKAAVKWGKFIEGDLRNIEEIEMVFQKYNIEAVFHFAAYAYVGESVVNPEKYYYNNVVNTLNLLSVMNKYNCKKIIFSSSCASYGEPEAILITEEMHQCPINPYGKTKLIVEKILEDYRMAYGLEYVVLRYFNAAGADPEGEIGEHHIPETHLIPLVLDAAYGKRTGIEIFGTDYETPDGTCIRDYIHVLDLVEAHIKALNYLERDKGSNCFNLGSGVGVSVLEIVNSARKVTGKNILVIQKERRQGDPARLVGDNTKAKKILGWKPAYDNIDIIIKHAWNWHRHMKY